MKKEKEGWFWVGIVAGVAVVMFWYMAEGLVGVVKALALLAVGGVIGYLLTRIRVWG